jgi:uncharacterized lipoprotein YajG
MKLFKFFNALMAGAAALLVAGCAATPAPGDTAAPMVASAAPIKCKASEAGTGTSIVRKDCSGNPNVGAVDPKELMDNKRTALPNK